jgi:NADH:ubiquinone oxidoreductase subunit E
MSVGTKNKSDIPSIVQAAVARHGATPEALVPLLSEVNEKLGYLSTTALTEISRALRLPGSQLMAVASFYRMLSTKPRGRHVIQFCESAPCHVMGGRLVRRVLQEELGLEPGETSADGQWTLLAVSCPGLCGVGPVLMIDENIFGNITPGRIREILAQYKEQSL